MSNETQIIQNAPEVNLVQLNSSLSIPFSKQPFELHQDVVKKMFTNIRQRLEYQAEMIEESMRHDGRDMLATLWGCFNWENLNKYIDNLEQVQLGFSSAFTTDKNQAEVRHFEFAMSKLNDLSKINAFESSELAFEIDIHKAMIPPEEASSDFTPYADDEIFLRKMAINKGLESFYKVIDQVALRTSIFDGDTALSEDFIKMVRQMYRYWSSLTKLNPILKDKVEIVGKNMFSLIIDNIFGLNADQRIALCRNRPSTKEIRQWGDVSFLDLPLDSAPATLLLSDLKSIIRYLHPSLIGGVLPGSGAPSLGACLGHLPDNALITVSVYEDGYPASEDLAGDIGIHVSAVSVKGYQDLGVLAACSAQHAQIGSFNSECHSGYNGESKTEFEGVDFSNGFTFTWLPKICPRLFG